MDRLDALITDAHWSVDEALRRHFGGSTRNERRELAGVVILFSGGNDSTVLAHMMRERATYFGHANTGIGIEATRQFVRDWSQKWDRPLMERHPPAGSTYRDIVLSEGFPGPGKHWKMYQRLKLRCIEQMQAELIGGKRWSYSRRVLLLAGRRVQESKRREQRDIPQVERHKSAVWCSPLRNWTALDLNDYRRRFPDCPRNPVADFLHMSGECLCGSFAKPGELDEIGLWHPEVRAEIEALEVEATAAGIPAPRNRWGWGAYRRALRHAPRTGAMCSSCTIITRP